MSGRALRIVATLALALGAAHCALVFDTDALGPGAAAEAGDESPADSGADGVEEEEDAAPPREAGGDGRGPTGLDIGLALADLDATPCRVTGGGIDFDACGTDACRMATAASGRCEDCTNRCTLHLGDPCVHSWDCDSLHECFRGRCANRCTLGDIECGKLGSCLDVGYLGGYGVCDPSAK